MSIALRRPVRSSRRSKEAPILPVVMGRIRRLNKVSYASIRKEYDAVAKYFKWDPDKITDFWLSYFVYDYEDENECILLRYLLYTVGLHQPLVLQLLDDIHDKSILRCLGVVRCRRGTTKFYRIYAGDHV
jgi:hypothetical protein